MKELSKEEVAVLHKSQWLSYAKQLKEYNIGDVVLPDYSIWKTRNIGIGNYACIYVRQFNGDCGHCPIDWYEGKLGNIGKLWCLEKESINRKFYNKFFEFKNNVCMYLMGKKGVSKQDILKESKELAVLAEEIANLPIKA